MKVGKAGGKEALGKMDMRNGNKDET